MGRVFFSQTVSIETYLRALGKKYGEDVRLCPSYVAASRLVGVP